MPMRTKDPVKKLRYQSKSQMWKIVDIQPTIELPEKGIISARKFKEICKITDENKNLYSSKSEQNHILELIEGVDEADDNGMLRRITNGLEANHSAIAVCPVTGEIESGNTRWMAILSIVEDESNSYTLDDILVKVEYGPYIFDKNVPSREKQEKLLQLNTTGKRDEMSVAAIYDRIIALLSNAHKKCPWIAFSSSSKTKFWKKEINEVLNLFKNRKFPIDGQKVKWVMDIYTSPKNLRHDFEENIKHLAEWSTVKDLVSNYKRISSQKQVDPKAFDFLKYINKNQSFKQDLTNSIVNAIKATREFYSQTLSDGTIIYHDNPRVGLKSCSFATTVSHKIMQNIAICFNTSKNIDDDMRDKLQAWTEITKNLKDGVDVIPDIKFPILSDISKAKNPKFEDTTWEVKVGTYTNDDFLNTVFYGGPGFRLCENANYLFVCLNKKATEVVVILKRINGSTDVNGNNTTTFRKVVTGDKNESNIVLFLGDVNFDKDKNSWDWSYKKI